MQILVLGGDGYLGWPTALHLSALGHDVAVSDNFVRRRYDEETRRRESSADALSTTGDAWAEVCKTVMSYVGDLREGAFVHDMIADFDPDTIVHFAEQCAAPYSMIDQAHAVDTQTNNVVGTLNVIYAIGDIDRDIHLVKLGTMGEYGTPNIDIEEGWLRSTHRAHGPCFSQTARVLLPSLQGPRQPQHRVRLPDLGAAGDRPQPGGGVRRRHRADEARPGLSTRFDYDGVFGTVLNRMVIQAVLGHPLTVYGEGTQTRGLINIVDTVECIRIASENPAGRGEFRFSTR